MKKNKEQLVWMTDIDTYAEIVELAQKRGKKTGDSMQQEFEEILKKRKIKLLGQTDYDLDLLTGNIREMGLKVLNLKELNRRKK